MLNIAWARQPEGYRTMCQRFGYQLGGVDRMGKPTPLSPRNRRVRFTADMALAHDVERPEQPPSRQVRRREARR